MDKDPRYGLGDACEQFLEYCIADWRREYAPATRHDEVLAGPLHTIELKCDLRPAGVVDLTVKCFGRRAHDNEVYFAKLQRLDGVYAFLT